MIAFKSMCEYIRAYWANLDNILTTKFKIIYKLECSFYKWPGDLY